MPPESTQARDRVCHGGRLPGPGRRDRQLDPQPGGAEGGDQVFLALVEGPAVGFGLEQGEAEDGVVDGPAVPAQGVVDDPGLGVEHRGGGVEAGVFRLVHRAAVAALQLFGDVDIIGPGQRHRPADHLVGDRVDGGVDHVAGQVQAPELPVGLGHHMRRLPPGP